MKSLSHNFIILQCIGLWRPDNWSTGWKTCFYETYTCLMIFLVTTVILSEFIALIGSIDDVEAFTNNSFMLLTMIADFGKGANILKRRRDIIELTNILKRDPCRPINDEEIAIQRKFDRLTRSNTLGYATLIAITVLALILRSFVDDVPRRALPYESWLPFEHHESLLVYTIAYSHQIITLMAAASCGVAFDTLVHGLLLQICSQLNILKHRLRDIPKVLINQIPDRRYDDRLFNPLSTNLEAKLLSRCVKHHLEIFEFAKKSNDMFGLVIFLQYTVSATVLCVSVFMLSNMMLFSVEFMSHMLYLACMLTQIFIFCLYGHEVTFQSLNVCDAIYDTDWNSLSIKTKKGLLTIMMRTLSPIEITSMSIIVLNLESFKSLSKLSYSAYNVLQR